MAAQGSRGQRAAWKSTEEGPEAGEGIPHSSRVALGAGWQRSPWLHPPGNYRTRQTVNKGSASLLVPIGEPSRTNRSLLS